MKNETEKVGEQEEEWLPISPETEEAGSKKRVSVWALVLKARHLPCRAERFGAGWRLLVPAARFEKALEELRLYEEENRNWPPPLPPENPPADNVLTTLAVLILLASFHNITLLDIDLPGHHPVDWSFLGNAHAAKILSGQWWRPVTALCLHTDWIHLLGNLAVGGVFITRLCRDLGSGLAWSLVLASGALGNLVNACLQHPGHRAVGASTAVFGTVGILAAISLVRYRRNLWRRWPLPIAAAMALLAFLGTAGDRTDLGAHLFGFSFGIALGALAGYWSRRHGLPGRRGNALLSTAGIAVVLSAWWAALTAGG